MNHTMARGQAPILALLFFAMMPLHFAWTICPVAEKTVAPYGSVRSSIHPDSMISEILEYVNDDRKMQGLSPLKLSDVESSIAAKHSRDMASGKVPFGHSGLNARAKAIRKALGEIMSVGENVASGPMSAREVVDGWLKSPGHKRNIEGDFTLTGIGIASDKQGNIYFTQIFSR